MTLPASLVAAHWLCPGCLWPMQVGQPSDSSGRPLNLNSKGWESKSWIWHISMQINYILSASLPWVSHANVGLWTTGIDNKKKKKGKNKANALLMQTISDSNGWRQGVVAVSIGTIASFPSVHINFSENLSYLLFSSLLLAGLETPMHSLENTGFWRLVETRGFGVLIHQGSCAVI